MLKIKLWARPATCLGGHVRAPRGVLFWRGVFMRRVFLLLASAAILVFTAAPGTATAGGSHDNAGQESQDAADAANWFIGQRLAPNGAVNANAFAEGSLQAKTLSSTPGTWTERTSLAGATGNDFSDPPAFIDPTSNFSNSGAGDRWVGGRMTSLAAAGGVLYAGAADGGV